MNTPPNILLFFLFDRAKGDTSSDSCLFSEVSLSPKSQHWDWFASGKHSCHAIIGIYTRVLSNFKESAQFVELP